MDDEHISSDAAHTDSRRRFLRRMGCVTVAVVANTVQSRIQGGELSTAYIRIRERMAGQGWKFYKVKSLRSYPVGEGEEVASLGDYGGIRRVNLGGTGKFRVQKEGERWWLVDPEGHPFISCGVNTINPRWNSVTSENVSKIGSEGAWLKGIVARLKSSGFNTAGYWSRIGGEKMAYTYYDFSASDDPVQENKQYGLMACFMTRIAVASGRRVFPAFHSEFEAFCEQRTERLKSLVGDPWLVGYFTDNELPLPSLRACLEISPQDPHYGDSGREAQRWWKERSSTVNRRPSEQDEADWVAHVYEWYLSVAVGAVRRRDASHLILGSRLYSRERNCPQVLAAAGRHVDVVVLNPYGMPIVPLGRMQDWSNWSGGKPILIGEFYVKALSAKVHSMMGAGLVVATQSDRGLYYQNYAINLLDSKVCVGWHWHQLTDGVRVNTGLIGGDLEVYEELWSKCHELNRNVYSIAGVQS